MMAKGEEHESRRDLCILANDVPVQGHLLPLIFQHSPPLHTVTHHSTPDRVQGQWFLNGASGLEVWRINKLSISILPITISFIAIAQW